MNTITYKSGNLQSYPSYRDDFTYEQFKTTFKRELSASTDKIKKYFLFKQRLNEESQQKLSNESVMSLNEIRESMREREVQITHFIETLTDNQITLLYLLFQTGSDILTGTTGDTVDIYKLLYQHIDPDFNFNYTNNRQFKLSYFHDYLFTRYDGIKNVLTAVKELKVTL